MKKTNGFSLIEVVVGAAILAAAFAGLLGAYRMYLKAAYDTTDRIKAVFLAEEGLEAVRLIRDFGWTENIGSLPLNSLRYISWNGTRFTVTDLPQYINAFERSFILETVYRDAADSIVSSGAPDPDTRKVTMKVSWPVRGSTSTLSLSAYITNVFND